MGQGAGGEYWRQVPKVNILVQQRASHQSSVLLRVFLILLFLFLAFIMQSQFRLRAQAEADIENGVAHIQSAQRQLDNAQSEMEPIRAQISALKRRRQAAGNQNRQVTSGLIDWHAAMSALLGIQAEGISFTSITTQPDGVVSLSGDAPALGAMSNLPAQFSVVSDILNFQGIKWDLGRDPPTFIATFAVQ